MNKEDFTTEVTAKAIPAVEEVAVSASAINNVGIGQLYKGVAALVMAGVIDLDEARKMIKKSPLTVVQSDRMKAAVRFHKNTGVDLPPARAKWLVEVLQE